MTKERKIQAEKIHIRSMRTIRGNVDCPVEMDVDDVHGHRFKYELRTALMSKLNCVGLKLTVEIIALNEKEKDLPIHGSYTHEFMFEVENLGEFLSKTGKHESIDAGLGSTLVSILFSTVRGIIYSRTHGTSLGVVVLPVVAPLRIMNIDPDKIGAAGEEKTEQKKRTVPGGSGKKVMKK